MKTITVGMFISLVAAAMAAPFFALAVVVGLRAVSLTGNAQDNILLVGLAAGAAALGMLKARGEGGRVRARGVGGQLGAGASGARKASALRLGY
jgi:hypothetical protein